MCLTKHKGPQADERDKRKSERSHLGQSWLTTVSGSIWEQFLLPHDRGPCGPFQWYLCIHDGADAGLEIQCASSCGLPSSQATLLKGDSDHEHQCSAPLWLFTFKLPVSRVRTSKFPCAFVCKRKLHLILQFKQF